MPLPSWAQVSDARRAHVERVAALVAQWAAERRATPAEGDRWVRAAYLHDALRDAPDALLVELAPADWGSPQLRHGPAAAAMARRHGETDQGVLDAVCYHTIGYAGWDDAGRMLYAADYLEPGRTHTPERAALAARMAHEPQAVLRAVAAERLQWQVSGGHPLRTETVDFWNALVGGA